MACSQPFLYNPYHKKNTHRLYSVNQLYYPCGWCLNCRVDKQNQLRDRCEFEYIDKKCGAFVTFTFDDRNLYKHMKYDSTNGKLIASLSKKSCKDFLNRLNKLVHKQENNLLCNHNYKYLIVGEYGQHGDNPAISDRPHYHALFFGLDFAYCEKMFAEAWQQQGNIFVGNIGDGAIGYCLKYLDKQVFGELAKIKYDNHGLERPFQHHSMGLGSKLFEQQQDYILKNDFNYWWHGHDTPVPIYYRNKYWKNTTSNYAVHIKKLQKDIEKYKIEFGHKPKNLYDLKDFHNINNNIRQKNLMLKQQQHGSPMYDTEAIKNQVIENQIKQTYPNDYIHRLNIPPLDVATLVKGIDLKSMKVKPKSWQRRAKEYNYKYNDPIPF